MVHVAELHEGLQSGSTTRPKCYGGWIDVLRVEGVRSENCHLDNTPTSRIDVVGIVARLDIERDDVQQRETGVHDADVG